MIDDTPDSDRDNLRNILMIEENQLLLRLARTSGDQRWLAIAKTHLEQAFMAWKRAIYGGKRAGDVDERTSTDVAGGAPQEPSDRA